MRIGGLKLQKIQITRGTMIKGRPVFPGEILDVDDPTARELFYCNKAVAYVAPLAPEKPQADQIDSQPSEEADAPTDKRRRRK